MPIQLNEMAQIQSNKKIRKRKKCQSTIHVFLLKGFESLFLKGNREDRLLLMLCPLTSSLVCENKRRKH